jgi:hypothetical protein
MPARLAERAYRDHLPRPGLGHAGGARPTSSSSPSIAVASFFSFSQHLPPCSVQVRFCFMNLHGYEAGVRWENLSRSAFPRAMIYRCEEFATGSDGRWPEGPDLSPKHVKPVIVRRNGYARGMRESSCLLNRSVVHPGLDTPARPAERGYSTDFPFPRPNVLPRARVGSLGRRK